MSVPVAALLGGLLGFVFYGLIPSPGESGGLRFLRGLLCSSAGVVAATLVLRAIGH